ncbi:hypothetical protein EB796_016200 [Bugula neritina]|uniref:Caspase family p20 domain-containing protein n=1 Tax=Bugula neritina TaxID=10212 RepID=A0A7J7JIN7_BUGNE|nr:hypothetical protein EB796_016200 [Bugula neritina]
MSGCSMLSDLLVVFYSHEGSRWSQRRESFVPFLDENRVSIELEQFDAFVKLFNRTAAMDMQLFSYLIQSETLFKTKTDLNVAVNVLKAFRLIYGPVVCDVTSTGFYIPYMVEQFSNRDIMSKEELSLRVDLVFKGLSLPQHAYHQMSVGMLELFPSLIASLMVHRDGASVFHDGLVVQLIHDYKSRQVSIYVASTASRVCEMWKQLLNITNNALQQATNSWPASRPVVLSFCAHCLLIQDQHPEKLINPHWAVIPNKQESSPGKSVIQRLTKIFSRGTPTKPSAMLDNTSSLVVCKKEKIFALLKYPHTSDCLPASESDKFTEFVKQLKSRGEQANAELIRQMNERLPVAMGTEDDLSDLSEDDDIIVPEEDETHQNVEIRLTVTPTTHPKVKELFNNTNEAYKMTKKRGRALIINNEHFSERPDLQRKGSSADVKNMANVMKAFKFEVLIQQNLKAEVI